MSGKKGMKHYPESTKTEVLAKLEEGRPIRALSREYRISRYAIYSWAGRGTKKEKTSIPKRRGRKRKIPIATQKELETENKRLKMEVDLLRSFLQAAGRR